MARPKAIKRLSDNRKKKAPVVTPAELKKLLFVVKQTRNPERNTLIVWLLFIAGFRVSEVAQIEPPTVLFKDGSIRETGLIPSKYCKNNKAGHVFFHSKKLREALKAYIEFRVSKRLMLVDSKDYRGLKKDAALILSENKRPYSLKKKIRKNKDGQDVIYWACDTLQDMVSKWGREAGIKGFSAHSGRRTLATRLARAGHDEDLIAAILRHESDGQPYEYIDADLKGIRKTVESMYSMDNEDFKDIELA